jgi:anti-anti-sigma factor
MSFRSSPFRSLAADERQFRRRALEAAYGATIVISRSPVVQSGNSQDCELRLSGQLNVKTLAEVLPLMKAAQGRAVRFTLDLLEVDRVTSAGLGILVMIDVRARAAGGSLEVLNCNSEVAALLSVVNECSNGARINFTRAKPR